jgi:predicted ATPase
MDNCEHLLEAAARLVDRLLDSCPHLSILATSREAICVEGEARWLVPPLSVPEDGSPSEELEGYESVRLFVDRAGGVILLSRWARRTTARSPRSVAGSKAYRSQ